MDMIANTFQQTFTLEWLSVALPISLLLSLLVSRVTVAGILSIVAVAIHHLGPTLLPLFQQSASQQTMMDAVSASVAKMDPVSVAMELIAYAFLIAVFALTRQDMFRPAPVD
jgi:hypothetical protein